MKKATRDITIRVTEEERNLIEVIRGFSWGKYGNDLLYENDSPTGKGYLNNYISSLFVNEIEGDVNLLACYDVAVQEIGKTNLFLDLASYTPFIVNLGFQKPVPSKDVYYRRVLQKKEIKKGYAKRKIDCLYVTNLEEAIADFKEYLKKNYLEKGLNYISECNKFNENPYIEIKIKRYEIPYYKGLLNKALIIEGDLQQGYDDDEYLLESKGMVLFFEKFLKLLDNRKDTVILKLHSAYIDSLAYMFEMEMDSIEDDIKGVRYSLFRDLDDIYDNEFIPNYSPKEREIRAKSIKSSYEKLLNLKEENRKLIEYFKFEKDKDSHKYLSENIDLSLKISKEVVLNNEKRRNKMYKFDGEYRTR